jgi:hypothetical protein
VWDYTPRQIAGYGFLIGLRRKAEMGEQLSLQALAAQGDNKAIRQQMKTLTKDIG